MTGHLQTRYSVRVYMIVITITCAIVGVLSYHYRFHLMCKYVDYQSGPNNYRAIPVYVMPTTDIAPDWTQCEAFDLVFALPPEMAINRSDIRNGVVFRSQVAHVVVERPEPYNIDGSTAIVENDLKSFPKDERTLPRLIFACHQFDNRAFTWAMSPTQAERHASLMVVSPLVRMRSTVSLEGLFTREMDGVVRFRHSRADFTWQSRTHDRGGHFHFSDYRDMPERSWIRAVCNSVKLRSQ
jgi:hypothetical protein